MRFVLFLSLFLSSLYAEEQTTKSEPLFLPWTTNFENAKATAKAQNLPMYLYVTGSSWCVWCKKMDREIHSQDAFRQKLIGKVVFVKIDLPASMEPGEETQKIMTQYHIQGVPTVLLLSPDGQELGRFGYRQLTPDAYADVILSSIKPSETPQSDLEAPKK